MKEIGEYQKLQKENKLIMRSNPRLAKKARKLGLKNVGYEEVNKLNQFLKNTKID